MFQTAAGVTVPFPEKLSEQYELDGSTITANLSFEKLSDFVHSFYAELDEPLFLAIHPDAESDEVWYLDGMTKKQLTMILDGYGELLYQDGLSAFAIGSLTTEEELFVQKYKVLSILQRDCKAFRSPAEKNTAWSRPDILSPHGICSPKKSPAPQSASRSPVRPCRI